MLRSIAIGIILTLLSCGASSASTVGPDVIGYQERACGFDTDRDGIVGEAGECDYCNGTEPDPDGDTNNERIVYVNCDAAGNDDASCGAAGDPCSTIGYALETRGPAMAGTEEIIVCFQGTACSVTNEVLPDGKAGTTSAGPFGAQDVAFTYPTHPAMLIGWDTDADGCYWPADNGVDNPATASDDGCGAAQAPAAITDCGATGDCYGFVMEGDGTINFEMAHFTTPNFNSWTNNPVTHDGTPGAGGASNVGFINFLNGIERFVAHDIAFDGLLAEQPKCGDVIPWRMYADANLDHVKFSNNSCLGCGGFGFRGGVGNESPDHTGIWVENFSFRCHPCDTFGAGTQCGVDTLGASDYCGNGTDVRNGCDVMKMWGDVSNVRVIRAHLDGDIDDGWNGNNSSGLYGVVVNDNNRDFKIIESEFYDWKTHVSLEPDLDGTGLTARSQDEIYVDKCHFESTALAEAAFKNGSGRSTVSFISIIPGDADAGVNGIVEDFFVRSSTFKSSGDLKAALMLEGGSPVASTCDGAGHPGTWTLENLTINADQNFSPASLIQMGWRAGGTQPLCQQETYVLRNIIINGEDAADARNDCVAVEQAVVDEANFSFTWSNIVGDADCDYFYGSTQHTNIDAFTTAAGGNTATTDECVVSFEADGVHITTGDTCAKDNGIDLSGSFTRDRDAQLFDTWDIGADEPNPAAEGCTVNADCADANACTDDVCSAGSCTNPNVANGTACGSSTNNDCTDPDTCQAGVCVANDATAGTSAPTQCADSNTCTNDQCNGSGGCQNPAVANGTACGSATDTDCTDPDTCSSGACVANDATAGTSCNDSLFCNGADTCNGTGTCTHAGDPCTPPATCNETGDTCDGGSVTGVMRFGR